MMGDEEVAAIVIDNGSGYIRSGYAGDDAPRSVMRNVLGFPRQVAAMVGHTYKSSYVGDAAQTYRGILALRYPVEHGYVKNWEAMETMLDFIFENELRVDPKQQALLLTVPTLNPDSHRDKWLQLLLEKYDIPATNLEIQPSLSVYSSGRNTAMVLEIGDGVIQTLPICNGYTIRNAITRYNFGGRDLTQHLTDLLRERGHYFESSSDSEQIRKMKEELCYIALDFKQELDTAMCYSSLEKTFALNDGYEILLNNERFRVGEVLFKPDLIGREAPGIHELLYDAIQRCPADLRNSIYGNIVVAGGTTMFSGFADRLTKEMAGLAPATSKIKVIAPPERKFSSWIGGSILASLSTYQQRWISREEYMESGLNGRKCTPW